uniref:Uncharacterized protein n=1 Tax=Hucho hucho TaxID=62062 RepID=A0A4W5LA09_9TELE
MIKQMNLWSAVIPGDGLQDVRTWFMFRLSRGNDSHPSDGPEPQRNRQLLFNKVTEKSLEKFISDARFGHTFNPFYKKNPRVTENIHKQLRKYLQRTLQDWAPSRWELQCKLVLRDKLEEAAKNSQYPAWLVTVCHQRRCWGTSLRPTPPYYLKQEACLRRELKKIWQENAVLARRVQAGRKGITQTEQRSATAVEGECNRRHCASVSEFQMLSSSLCPPATFDDPEYSPVLKQIGKGDT